MGNDSCSAASCGSAALRTFPTIATQNKKAIVFAFLHQRWLRIGAADEARTRYLHLGKVALYQMSYGRTFHWFVPGFRPATLVIIPHTPAVVNHKFTFFQKRMSFCSDTSFFYFACGDGSALFVLFCTAVCTNKIQLLSISQTIIIKRTLCQTENVPARVQLPFIEKKKELPAKRS